jgi:hypothetical protein
MNQENIIAVLRERLQLKEQELAATQADVDALRRSLAILGGQEPVSNERQYDSKEQRPLRLTPALMSIFEQDPEKKWTPLQLREELERMKREGRFQTKSKDFFPAMHGTLLDLSKRGFLKRAKYADRITYRKSQ